MDEEGVVQSQEEDVLSDDRELGVLLVPLYDGRVQEGLSLPLGDGEALEVLLVLLSDD